MQLVVYLLSYPLLWLVSRLPFKLLYLISDGVYFLIYHLIGYRKKVVRSNLELVFPEKSEHDIISIEKKFYRHMCDIFLEMIKTMGMTIEQMNERFHLSNEELINEYADKNRSTVLLAGHYASWEWLLAINQRLKPEALVIYQKINNDYFDRLVKRIRGKFGTSLIRTNESRKIIANLVKENRTFVLGIASDQSPMVQRARHWTDFMGVTVPVHIGAEELCKNHDLIPLFLEVKKVKRGHYAASFRVLTENPNEVTDYGITEAFLNELEKSIRAAPEYYFWTHKRWKHRNKVPGAFRNT